MSNKKNIPIDDLIQTQKLVLDILHIKRGHYIPKTDRKENVLEHSFSVATLSWKLYSALKLDLNLEKVLRYALCHDFSERGLENDTNAYANTTEKLQKAEREALVLEKLEKEFDHFEDMVTTLKDYENVVDEEARFVKSVDKIQAITLGGMDDWRQYKEYGTTYDQFKAKGEEFIANSPECLKETFRALLKESTSSYYDNPDNQ